MTTRSVETRSGTQSVEVQTLKRRTLPPLHGRPVRGNKEHPLDMFDLVERVKRLGTMARRLEAYRDAEAFASDKNELIRSIGRLESDLQRRGVR